MGVNGKGVNQNTHTHEKKNAEQEMRWKEKDDVWAVQWNIEN